MSQEREWSGVTHGTQWMHRALISVLKVCPLVLMYLVMALVIPFYLVFNRQGYLSIYHYLRRRQGWSVIRSFLGCYANHFLFGTALLDRFATYAGRRFRTENPDNDLLKELSAGPEGLVMLASHIGNAEMSGYMLSSEQKRMNAITFPGEKASIRTWRDKMFGAHNVRLISADPEMNWLFTLNAALADGEIVSIHGDRTFGSPKTLEVNLLGAPAQIPQGPFSIAAMRDLPVLAIFSLKTGFKSYRVMLRRLDTPELREMGRDQKLQELADRYAHAVEDVLRKWPLQWYNFFEFWKN